MILKKPIKTDISQLEQKGWILIPRVYDLDLIKSVKAEYIDNKNYYLNIQKRKGMLNQTQDVCFHTILRCRKSLSLFERNNTSEIIENHFRGKYILNTMSISEIKPKSDIYTLNIHRDIRSFSGSSKLWLISLIMLDDSTIDNGATWLLEKEKNTSEKPNDKYFNSNAIRVEGKAGDVLLFNGNLWHRSGKNNTNHTRTIITPVYSKPFIKQQLDYPRAFGEKFLENCSEHLSQVLGYNALTPYSVEQFYQKNSKDRYYKPDQG